MGSILQSSRTEDITAEIGARLKALRLGQNMRISDLAGKSGVSARTIARLEKGDGVNLENLIRVLRALGRLQALDTFLPPPTVSPLQLAKLKGRERKRARPANG